MIFDNDWLAQKYVEELLSIRQIAALMGLHYDTTRKRLVDAGVKLREQGEGLRLRQAKGIGSKYGLLNDRDWLLQKYVGERKSTKEIAALLEVKSCNSVRQALIRNQIPVRSVSEGLTCNREGDGFCIDTELLEGCLLGDGFLSCHNRRSDISMPAFHKRNKFYDHVAYVAKTLFGQQWAESITEERHRCRGKTLRCFHMRSLTYKELLPFHRRWYPASNNYKKLVPLDLVITPKVLLHWFLDDGNAYHRRKQSKTKQVKITLCSECFCREDQELLVQKIQTLGLTARVQPYNQGTGWRVGFPQSQTNDFYQVIGPPPVASLDYKWK